MASEARCMLGSNVLLTAIDVVSFINSGPVWSVTPEYVFQWRSFGWIVLVFLIARTALYVIIAALIYERGGPPNKEPQMAETAAVTTLGVTTFFSVFLLFVLGDSPGGWLIAVPTVISCLLQCWYAVIYLLFDIVSVGHLSVYRMRCLCVANWANWVYRISTGLLLAAARTRGLNDSCAVTWTQVSAWMMLVPILLVHVQMILYCDATLAGKLPVGPILPRDEEREPLIG